MPKLNHLSGKQQAWIDSYLIHENATQAAYDAGYAGSRTTLQAVGAENLAKPMIAKALQSAQKRASYRTDISQDEIIGECKLIWLGLDTPASAKVQALTLAARITGILIDKSQHITGTPEQYALSQALGKRYDAMSLPELLDLRGKQQLALSEGHTATEGPSDG